MAKFIIKHSLETTKIVAQSRISVEIENFAKYASSQYKQIDTDSFEFEEIEAKW